MWWTSSGGGALVLEVGYHPHKKNHGIRVVFQDQAMYVRRGAKMCIIGEKIVFLIMPTNFGKDMMEKNKKIA